MEKLNIKELSPERQQAFADLLLHEKHRHIDDILHLDEDLRWMKKYLNIVPSDIYVGTYIECSQNKQS
jgi:hypothetical protein